LCCVCVCAWLVCLARASCGEVRGRCDGSRRSRVVRAGSSRRAWSTCWRLLYKSPPCTNQWVKAREAEKPSVCAARWWCLGAIVVCFSCVVTVQPSPTSHPSLSALYTSSFRCVHLGLPTSDIRASSSFLWPCDGPSWCLGSTVSLSYSVLLLANYMGWAIMVQPNAQGFLEDVAPVNGTSVDDHKSKMARA
jgi:hypothetical protein